MSRLYLLDFVGFLKLSTRQQPCNCRTLSFKINKKTEFRRWQSSRKSRTNKWSPTKNQERVVKNILDDELYHDTDFEFIDRKERVSMKKLFQLDQNNEFTAKKRSFKNALFDDDQEDIKLDLINRKSKTKLDIKNLHDVFKKEYDKDNSTFNEKLLKKKLKKTLVPLPYDITEENRFEILNKIVMPYGHLPYQIQLKRKFEKNRKVLQSFGQKLHLLNTPIRIGSNQMPCFLEQVRLSPLTNQYRNKDEFSVWPGYDGNPKTVGFFVGQPSLHERVVCVEPDQMQKVSKQSHIDLAKSFQLYLREKSPYDVCQNFGEGGNWRRVHIRSNEAQQHMVTAIMHPQQLNSDELNKEMDRLKEFFSDFPLVKSLYFHAARHTRSTHTGEPYYHLAGNPIISEYLFNKRFEISPASFFQVNTKAAEVLYRVIMTELNVNKQTTLLDLCCGTGILSILLSDQVKKIIAIDSSASAIEDAKRNASLNNVDNIEFITGTIEEVLPKIAEQNYFDGNIMAVANPSRRALHPRSIQMLQQMKYIEKLVYASCKPEGDALRNFVQLCQPVSGVSSQFFPINAIPVDLFPHTEHCELVLTFERA